MLGITDTQMCWWNSSIQAMGSYNLTPQTANSICEAPHRITACILQIAPWKKSYDKPRQHIKKQKHHFADKGPYGQSYGFSSRHV